MFNVEPKFGEPARFGFIIPRARNRGAAGHDRAGGPGTGEEYADYGRLPAPSARLAGLLESAVTLLGCAGRRRCTTVSRWAVRHGGSAGGTIPDHLHPPAFLTLPSDVHRQAASVAEAEIDSWAQPKSVGERFDRRNDRPDADPRWL